MDKISDVKLEGKEKIAKRNPDNVVKMMKLYKQITGKNVRFSSAKSDYSDRISGKFVVKRDTTEDIIAKYCSQNNV